MPTSHAVKFLECFHVTSIFQFLYYPLQDGTHSVLRNLRGSSLRHLEADAAANEAATTHHVTHHAI